MINENHLYFVTTNHGKFEEVQRWLAQVAPNIQLEQAPLDPPEIQSLDLQEVITAKAEVIWPLIKAPFLVDDGGIYLDGYNNFPGTLSKYVYQGIGLDGFWKLAKDNPRGYFLSMLAYMHGPAEIQYFEGKCVGGFIAPTEEIKQHPSLPYTKLLVPDGSKNTLAHLRGTEEEKKFHHRYQAVTQFAHWWLQRKK